jgi:hypothetical protein
MSSPVSTRGAGFGCVGCRVLGVGCGFKVEGCGGEGFGVRRSGFRVVGLNISWFTRLLCADVGYGVGFGCVR